MNNISKVLPIIGIILIGCVFMIKNSSINFENEKHIVSGVESDDKRSKDLIEGVGLNESNSEKEIGQTINKNDNEIKSYSDSNMSKNITIYISGEVASPGVVDLISDDRLIDGVELCGGVTVEADLNRINLAMKIEDEGHYIIPKIGEDIEGTIEINNVKAEDENTLDNNQTNDSNKININTATLTELDSLTGIGEVTAQKIIDYRDENSKFNNIEELKNVKGIGDKKFNDVKDYICVQ